MGVWWGDRRVWGGWVLKVREWEVKENWEGRVKEGGERRGGKGGVRKGPERGGRGRGHEKCRMKKERKK